jgi:hypothetical protein
LRLDVGSNPIRACVREGSSPGSNRRTRAAGVPLPPCECESSAYLDSARSEHTSGRGETPDDEDDRNPLGDTVEVDFGEVLYTEDGQPVGRIRGVEAGGAFVSFREGMGGLSVEHARSGHEFGEAELVWRCTGCGEMGEIDAGLPEGCPECGEPKEALMYWTED